jgi:hypothetical protein
MPLTLGMDSLVHRLLSREVSLFHVIFNMNGIHVATFR